MIIWRGMGILVLLATCISLLVTEAASDLIAGKEYYATKGWPIFVAFLIPAILIWFVGQTANSEDNDHTFLAMPMQYWAIPLLLGGLVLGALGNEKPVKKLTPEEEERRLAAERIDRALASVSAPKSYPKTRAEAMQASSTPSAAPEPVATTPTPTPASTVPANSLVTAAPTIEKVWVDNRSKLYYTEGCAGIPETAYQMAKSLAKRQGYIPAAGCR